ncbi:MAG: sialidase family protein [Gaiellaceae bacterium]
MCSLLLVFGAAGASATTVVSVTDVTNDSAANLGNNEPDIAINPTNTSNLIAAWNDYGPGKSCGIGYSLNGGQSWTTTWLRGVTPEGGNPTYDYGAGDPSVGFLKDGTAVLACNAWSVKKPTALFTTRSTDGGQTWAPVQMVASGKNLGKNLDHPMLTIDRYNDRVLLAYTVWSGNKVANSYALVSSDDGLTYKGPFTIAADYRANAVDLFDVSLAGAPDGTIYSTTGVWQFVKEWSEQAVVVSQMRPGETSFTHSVKVRDLVPAPKTLPGESWRTSMQASIGVESNGTVDELTPDFVTGNLDMYLARSTDHGATFPSAAQVNLTHDATDQVMAWMSVAPNNRIDTVFYDYNRGTGLMDAVYGKIAAGGSTMTRTVLQSGIDGNSQPPRGAGGTPFMGDYLGIDSLNNLVETAWTGNGPQSEDIFSATITP